jgi:hypothetical protein
MEAAVQHCNLNSTKYSRLLAEAPNIEMLRHKICTNEKAEAPEREAVRKHGERETTGFKNVRIEFLKSN